MLKNYSTNMNIILTPFQDFIKELYTREHIEKREGSLSTLTKNDEEREILTDEIIKLLPNASTSDLRAVYIWLTT